MFHAFVFSYLSCHSIQFQRGKVTLQDCNVTDSVEAQTQPPLGAEIIKAWIIAFTLWLCLGDNFPLPSVVIGHFGSYHFIQISESQSGTLT